MSSHFRILNHSLPVPRESVSLDLRSWLGAWVSDATPPRPASRALSRVVSGAGLVAVVCVIAAWLLIRHVPWFGPMLADDLRSLLGSKAVTRLEETLATVEDRVQHTVSNGNARSLRDFTPVELGALTQQPSAVSPNRPVNVPAMYAQVAAAKDGVWELVPVRSTDAPVLYRTMLHPDPERTYAELFVFALDLRRLTVQAVAGSIEPRSSEPGPSVTRSGLVPVEAQDRLVAAFNGGFKAEHGAFGMMVNGVELLSPKTTSCTFAQTSDGRLQIAPWPALVGTASSFSWWRQTPPCMVEHGSLHPGLRVADSRNWGATLEGKTVIRRSAVGLTADGNTLLVGISNSTTARALATGMQHAGAVQAAQLDVNFSYPRFLLYSEDPSAGELRALGAVKGLLYQPDEYVRHASSRDFFYVTLR